MIAKEQEELLNEYRVFCLKNENISYSVDVMGGIPGDHKWVGGVLTSDYFYCIPNHFESWMRLEKKKKIIQLLTCCTEGKYKYTGGCYFNRRIYAFPRCSTLIEAIDPDGNDIIRIDIGEDYDSKEHHYGGVCHNGIVYQPPRDTDHILRTDLSNGQVSRISVSESEKKRYCGSIIYPPDMAYFLPEKNEKILKLDLRTERISFIGSDISPMCFDAKIGLDGNIYGYSAYGKGMLKIDIENDNAGMIFEDTYFGSYGTKVGINGKLYSVPGVGKDVWEYDVFSGKLRTIGKLEEDVAVKYAGGVTDRDGVIYLAPADSANLISYIPSRQDMVIPPELWELFYKDYY